MRLSSTQKALDPEHLKINENNRNNYFGPSKFGDVTVTNRNLAHMKRRSLHLSAELASHGAQREYREEGRLPL